MPAKVARPNPPAPDEYRISAVKQEQDGSKYHLRVGAIVETTDMRLEADEIDFDQDTGQAEARGNVRYMNFKRNEVVTAERVDYNVDEETGKFYTVRGSAPAKIEAKPGILTTNNPFSFTCEWAERKEERYICHNGTATNCKLPNPWWRLKGPVFDIIPGERAVAQRAIFVLRGIPLFYTPYFYKSLKRAPRKSGFLTPNIANSSRRGRVLAGGYYWAINRSYDAMYRGQYYSSRGFAHNVDFRGKPTQKSDFNFFLYGVNDRNGRPDNPSIKEGGYLMSVEARSELAHGFTARADINYLSSFRFRQAFTESIYEAIYSQVQSIAYVTKQWDTFSFDGVYQSTDNFLSVEPRDRISIRKFPAAEFRSRDRQVNTRVLPFWVSWDSSVGLLRRNQLAFQTRRFVERFDVNPRITTALHWKDFDLVPSFSIRETQYGSSLDNEGKLAGGDLLRSSQEVSVDLKMPSLARVYDVKNSWFGTKLKHVIEPRAQYRYVTGVEDFNRIIRFDSTDLINNTNQVEYGITNHFYAKRKGGEVVEVLSWELVQQRYFDPSFGGSVVPGQLNINQTTELLTGFSFIDRFRHYSPYVSRLKVNPAGVFSAEWVADYDPLTGGFLDSTLQANGRVKKFSISASHNQLNLPWAKANQITGLVGWGQENRHGWSAAMMTVYDYKVGSLIFANTQVTYNTDCCGFSVQFRRWNFGTRQENQFRVALAVANIGSFGTLKRQEKIF